MSTSSTTVRVSPAVSPAGTRPAEFYVSSIILEVGVTGYTDDFRSSRV